MQDPMVSNFRIDDYKYHVISVPEILLLAEIILLVIFIYPGIILILMY